jgi:hypothetical protein
MAVAVVVVVTGLVVEMIPVPPVVAAVVVKVAGIMPGRTAKAVGVRKTVMASPVTSVPTVPVAVSSVSMTVMAVTSIVAVTAAVGGCRGSETETRGSEHRPRERNASK